MGWNQCARRDISGWPARDRKEGRPWKNVMCRLAATGNRPTPWGENGWETVRVADTETVGRTDLFCFATLIQQQLLRLLSGAITGNSYKLAFGGHCDMPWVSNRCSTPYIILLNPITRAKAILAQTCKTLKVWTVIKAIKWWWAPPQPCKFDQTLFPREYCLPYGGCPSPWYLTLPGTDQCAKILSAYVDRTA